MNLSGETLSRRSLLKECASKTAAAGIAFSGFGALAARASAMARNLEDDYDFVIARVKFPCDTRIVDNWSTHPGGDRNLLEAISTALRCKVHLAPSVNCDNPYYGKEKDFNAVVTLDDGELLRRYPFLFMTAEGYFELTANQRANLKKHIDEGGFLLMDDCIANVGGDYFWQSARKHLVEIFGRTSVVRIPNEHEVFNNVYDLGKIGLPWVSGQKYHPAEGVFVGDRLAVFLSSTDIHCGWTDRAGKWYPGIWGKHTHKEAIQIGVNIALYAMSH